MSGGQSAADMASRSEHVAMAMRAMNQAYAPYSSFRVGAVLVTDDGTVFSGCNVENASFPAGICAERAALAAAVTGGCRSFASLVVVSEASVPSPPCGICRQALTEFGSELEIISVTAGGARANWRLSELLPAPFTPASLAHT